MKLATWNVNSLKARLPRVLELLEAHVPDVLLLQETKVADDAFPEAELAAAGYRSVHHSAGRWAGVAIVSRAAPADPRSGLEGEVAADEARWVEATVGPTRIVSVYVPNGRQVDTPPFEEKLRFLEAAAERIRTLAAAGPLAVGGDFNVCPGELDAYEGFVSSTHITEPERRRFQALLAAGTVDAFRHLHPDEAGFTWWDYRAGHFHKKLGLRIDAVLLTPGLAGRLTACGIDRGFRKGPKPSDHAPLIAEWS